MPMIKHNVYEKGINWCARASGWELGTDSMLITVSFSQQVHRVSGRRQVMGGEGVIPRALHNPKPYHHSWNSQWQNGCNFTTNRLLAVFLFYSSVTLSAACVTIPKNTSALITRCYNSKMFFPRRPTPRIKLSLTTCRFSTTLCASHFFILVTNRKEEELMYHLQVKFWVCCRVR